MNENSIKRHHAITQALVDLQKAVPESRIVYEDDDPNALPLCTVDGKRQVISMPDQPGYDLWVPRRKPQPGDEVTCSLFSVSLEKAILFLRGAPLKVIREIEDAPENQERNTRNRWVFDRCCEFMKSKQGEATQ